MSDSPAPTRDEWLGGQAMLAQMGGDHPHHVALTPGSSSGRPSLGRPAPPLA